MLLVKCWVKKKLLSLRRRLAHLHGLRPNFLILQGMATNNNTTNDWGIVSLAMRSSRNRRGSRLDECFIIFSLDTSALNVPLRLLSDCHTRPDDQLFSQRKSMSPDQEGAHQRSQT